MKTIIAILIILFAVPAFAQTFGQLGFLTPGAMVLEQNRIRHEQIERNDRYFNQNETLIDNRGGKTTIYQRNGNIVTGSDGTVCVTTGSFTTCD
jgi:hypothetical protein